ncbi:hypothetical protein ZIOFF_035101 [Zingiber officinale]|uniref:Uncharacterized protein n=1 Tax=Zingiber officinale TaxID=94328 RepID=A0A8J5GJP7_ZINOF|nr:hypothetical protein ZIOFF_035101 [Zingiber officinale]
MSDVWEFKNGVMRIVEKENLGGCRPQQLLVFLQTEELITSHQMLEDKLRVMSDVWEFKNRVMQIVEMENLGGRRPQQRLVYLQTELITSHQMLEDRLRD